MNRLQNETSPYLLQHQNNPVHWWPWCEEAFEEARQKNIPVLVSIGYSSCHWCHVMEKESFENEEVATIMNLHFVNIKVDREELPDVDHLYMDAVQAMTGSGGWPLNVFVTPDKKPFYGGTYFPPKRLHGRASWTEALLNVSQFFSQNREEVNIQADKLMQHLSSGAHTATATTKNVDPDKDWSEQMVKKILVQADNLHGGFGHAPKFPSTHALQVLLYQQKYLANTQAGDHVVLSLMKMAMGGIYDHIGGGFSRYSTDNEWIAPHFEKMLYDNALLIQTYSLAYQQFPLPKFKQVVYETIDWLVREMKHEEGGFYSAQDADSEGVEGKYYTWSYEELEQQVGEQMLDFAALFNVEKQGNWEHTNILFQTTASLESADISFTETWTALQQKLLAHRSKRMKPLTDDKVILGWNALMIKALVTASICFQEEEFLSLAEQNIQFIEAKMKSASGYFRIYNRGQSKINAYHDDLSYLVDAYLSLGKATGQLAYYMSAQETLNFIQSNFNVHPNGLYDFTAKQHHQIGIPKQEMYDGATPSSNAILCGCLQTMSYLFQHQNWSEQAQGMLQTMRTYIEAYPSSFAVWAGQMQIQLHTHTEVTLIGPDAPKWYASLVKQIKSLAIQFKVARSSSDTIPAFKSTLKEGQTALIICRNFTCLAPVFTLEEGVEKLKEILKTEIIN